MKKYFVPVICIAFAACSGASVKEKINKAGDITGQAVGEFTEGMSSGIEKAFDTKIELSQGLKSKGIEFGKTTISSDSGATDNRLTVYVIFHEDFKGSLTAKAFDKENVEMGRVKLDVEGKKEEAKYFEFHFDKRTDVDHNSRLVIE